MWRQSQLLFLLSLLLSGGSAYADDEEVDGCISMNAFAYRAVGGAPLDFESISTAAKSVASYLMSWVPAGGIMAPLQSLGLHSIRELIDRKKDNTAHANFICGKKQKSKKPSSLTGSSLLPA